MKFRLNDMQRYLVEEFVEEYKEGRMSRRDLLKRVLGITGGVASAATLLLAFGCQPEQPRATPSSPAPGTQAPAAAPTTGPTGTPAPAPRPAGTGTPAPGTPAPQPTPAGGRVNVPVPPDDPAITAADITFPGDGASLMGYLAQPKTGAPFAAVMVCHENRGLVEHIRDVTRRLAKAGFAALAVDLLSREGGTAKVDPAQVPGKLSANPEQGVADFQAAFRYLNDQPFIRKGAIGMVGFCYGGGITWRTAVALPELKAAVPYYGPAPAEGDVAKIQAAVLAIYGGNDQRITSTQPTMEAAMKRAGKTFESVVYPGAGHAFSNDTGANYNEQAANDAWQKTLAWFRKYLG